MAKFRKPRGNSHKLNSHKANPEILKSLPDGEACVLDLRIPASKLPMPSVPHKFVIISRAFLEMSQEELACELGITKRTVSRYENDQVKLPLPVAKAIYSLMRNRLRKDREG